MASLVCPFCGSPMSVRRSWAQTAVSTLVAAPAVPDMATQARCSSCGRVSAASDLRSSVAGEPGWILQAVLAAVGAVFVLVVAALWWG